MVTIAPVLRTRHCPEPRLEERQNIYHRTVGSVTPNTFCCPVVQIITERLFYSSYVVLSNDEVTQDHR